MGGNDAKFKLFVENTLGEWASERASEWMNVHLFNNVLRLCFDCLSKYIYICICPALLCLFILFFVLFLFLRFSFLFDFKHFYHHFILFEADFNTLEHSTFAWLLPHYFPVFLFHPSIRAYVRTGAQLFDVRRTWMCVCGVRTLCLHMLWLSTLYTHFYHHTKSIYLFQNQDISMQWIVIFFQSTVFVVLILPFSILLTSKCFPVRSHYLLRPSPPPSPRCCSAAAVFFPLCILHRPITCSLRLQSTPLQSILCVY